jgi:hypothetical protein
MDPTLYDLIPAGSDIQAKPCEVASRGHCPEPRPMGPTH